MVTIGGANFSVMAASPIPSGTVRIGGNRRSLSRPGAAGSYPKGTAGFNAREVPKLRSVRRKRKG